MGKKPSITRSGLDAAVQPTIDVTSSAATMSNKDNMSAADSTDVSYQPKPSEGNSGSVKQNVIAHAISGNGGSSGSGIAPTLMNASLRSIPYSGNDGTIIASAAGTPSFNQSNRSDSRYGQKTDNTARHINYVPSETYLIDYEGPKPLSEAPDAVQGALGHPENTFARVQKLSDAFPGAINFERSVDEITDDILLATTGQQIQEGGYTDVDPTITFDEKQESVPYTLNRGNFVPRNLHVRYNEAGELVDFYYDEDSYPCVVTGQLTQERANSNTVTETNRSEVDRQAMASKAGNEVESTWCPIPYAYPQPSADVLYLRTIEQQLGAQVYMATKMAAKAHSYQLNKATKDGMSPVDSAIQLALGDTVSLNRSKAYEGQFVLGAANVENSVFNRKFTSKGAPSAVVAMYDSVAKYNNRSDFLTQPRSFNMILKQGLANYRSFKINPYFAKAFDNTNVFSTIDRAYDPSAPVCILDGYALMNAYSLNELGSCYRQSVIANCTESNVSVAHLSKAKIITCDDFNGRECPVAKVIELADSSDVERYKLTSEDMSAVRRAMFAHYGHRALTEGIAAMIVYSSENDARFIFVCVDNTLPLDGDLILYTADGEDTSFKLNSVGDYLAGFPIYNDYLAAWYHNRQNWMYLQLRDPYTDGIKTFLRENAGLMAKVTSSDTHELVWPIAYTTKNLNAYSYLVMASIKYMQEQRAKALLDVLNYTANFEYPFSNIEDCSNYSALGGTQYGQTDIFELLEVRQMTPAAALRWCYPELYCRMGTDEGNKATLMPFYMTEDNYDIGFAEGSLSYDRSSMSYPVTRGGVRFSYADNIYGMTERDVRLIMDMMVKMPTMGHDDSFAIINGDGDPLSYKYSAASDGLLAIRGWDQITLHKHLCTPRELGFMFPVKGGYITPVPSDEIITRPMSNPWGRVNDPTTALIEGRPSFKVYCWVNASGTPDTEILAQGSSVVSRAANFTQQWYVFTASEDNAGSGIGLNFSDSLVPQAYTPFTTALSNTLGAVVPNFAPELRTNAASLWTRIQKMPFVLNPFAFSGHNVVEDPFTFNYIFGLVGFKASDFKEDEYNRMTQRMSEGWMYIQDPFLQASLMLK